MGAKARKYLGRRYYVAAKARGTLSVIPPLGFYKYYTLANRN